MQIPSLPTDNLYKFCAISGIVLFVFGASYPLQKGQELSIKVANTQTEAELAAKQADFWREDVSSQQEKVAKVTADIKALTREHHPSAQQVDLVESENGSTVAVQSNLIQTSRKMQLQMVRLSGEVRKLHILWWNLAITSVVGVFSMVVGGRLAEFGFRRWYTELQAPHDRRISSGRDITGT